MMTIRLLLWIQVIPWLLCFGERTKDDDRLQHSPYSQNVQLPQLQPLSLEVLLDTRSIRTMYGPISLRQLYGHIVPLETHILIDPELIDCIAENRITEQSRDALLSHQELQIYNGEIIAREFASDDPRWQEIQQHNYLSVDTATTIGQKISELTRNNAPFPIILLTGDMGTGKSVALTKICKNIMFRDPSAWTVTINVPKVFKNCALNDVTLETIINKVIPSQFRVLFKNVLEYRGQRIIMLFDNVDYMTGRHLHEILRLIRTTANYGVRIVLSGRKHIHSEMTYRQMDPLTISVGEMTQHESQQYLVSYFEKIIHKRLPSHAAMTVPWIRSNSDLYRNRLIEYATILADKLRISTLPKTPAALKIIAEEFTDKTIRIVDRTGWVVQPVDCLSYVLHQNPSPYDLSDLLDHVPFMKTEFYEKYFNKFQIRGVGLDHIKETLSNELLEHYGTIALDRTIAGSVEKEIVHLANNRIEEFLEFSGIARRSRDNRYQFEFCHTDYEHYFASNVIIDKFIDFPTDKLLQLFNDHRYSGLLEFVNARVNVLERSKLVTIGFVDNDLNSVALHNLIHHGFTNLFQSIIDESWNKGMNYKIQLEKFILSNCNIYRKPWKGMLTKRILGMIPRTSDHFPMGFPIKPLPSFPIMRRMQLLIEQDMSKVLEAVVGFKIDAEIHQDLLFRAAIQPITNINSVQTILTIIDEKNIKMAELIYSIIENLGEKAIPIVDLIREKFVEPVSYNPELLHLAVERGSMKLVKYVVETLKVPAIEGHRSTLDQRTLLETAMDANPVYSSKNWWEMMAYLSNKVTLKITFDVNINVDYYIQDMLPKVNDNRWLKLLLADVCNLLYNGKQDHIFFTDIFTSDQIVTAKNTIPTFKWVLQDSRAFELRRYLLTSKMQNDNTNSLTRFLMSYRENDPMYGVNLENYRKTIEFVFNTELASLSQLDLHQIYRALIQRVNRNFADVEYLKDLICVLNNGLLREIDYNTLKVMELEIKRLGRQLRGPTNNLQRMTIHRQCWQYIRELLQSIYTEVNYRRTITNSRGDSNTFGCLPNRQKRSTSVKCQYTWNDIDDVIDTVDKRNEKKIQINSDRFLKRLAELEQTNSQQAEQLLELVQYLKNNRFISKMITGRSQLLFEDVLNANGLAAYRQKQRRTDVINDCLQQSGKNKPFVRRSASKTWALHAASVIPLIRGLHATITACQAQDNVNNKNCLLGSTALAISIVAMPVGYFTPKYVPWTVNRISNVILNNLPSTGRQIMSVVVLRARNSAIKWGTAGIAHVFTIGLLGFDVYNIVEMSTMIDMCRQSERCLNKDKIEAIISLTFSCVSIPVTLALLVSGAGLGVGVIVGLVLMIIETFAFGINDVVYYSKNYNTDTNENFRIFFNKITFQSPPTDVQDLVKRQDWINNIRNYVIQLLNKSDTNIVAYGTGIGMYKNDKAEATEGSMNMAESNISNTLKLSRVLPESTADTMLLCLPKQNTKMSYDKKPQTVTDAHYNCINTFVIAHKERWHKRSSDTSYIIYDLELINQGHIIGSNNINNLFLINNGTMSMHIIGGIGNITNVFQIRNNFSGNIYINGIARKNILDLSATVFALVKFIWHTNFKGATISFGKNQAFYLYTHNAQPNLYVIGRNGKSDMFTCNHHKSHHSTDDQRSVTIDAGGGESTAVMDYVTDCLNTVVRPYTHIEGSNSTNIVYKVHVLLDAIMDASVNEVPVVISPQQSQFLVTFNYRPVILATISIYYSPVNKTLIWQLQYSQSFSLSLSIEPYQLGSLSSKYNDTTEKLNMETTNCMFIDGYFGSTIVPVIKQSDNKSIVTVEQLNVFASVNSTQLSNVFERYRTISSYDSEMFVVTKLLHLSSNRTYIFGSTSNDHFYIDANVTFLFGGDGSDVYVLNRQSPNYTWINNEAENYELDVLIIPENMCDSLRAETGSPELDCCHNSKYDVTLICSEPSLQHYVILQNYLLSPYHRHLNIYWRNMMYMLLPRNSMSEDYEDPLISLLFSLNDESQATLTLTSSDTNVVLNITNEHQNPLVAYRQTGSDDIVLARKYFDPGSSSIVILQQFFSNVTTNVAVEWLDVVIVIVNDTILNDNLTMRNLTAIDILLLLMDNSNETEDGTIVEYSANITDVQQTIDIHHNKNCTQTNNAYSGYKLGILLVYGAESNEFHPNWIDNGTLSLCARNTCINLADWCKPIHRLQRIEFISPLRLPIVIHTNEIACQQQQSTDYDKQKHKLEEIFVNTHHRALLTNDNDDSRLLRCVGTIFADNVARNFMYKLFGFTSIIEQYKFMRDNCKKLLTPENLDALTKATLGSMLNSTINVYLIDMQHKIEDKVSVENIRDTFDELDDDCWEKFKKSLCNHENSIKLLTEMSNILSTCSKTLNKN